MELNPYESGYSPERFISQALGRVESNRARVGQTTGQRQELPSWAQYFTSQGQLSGQALDPYRQAAETRAQTNEQLAGALGVSQRPLGLLQGLLGILDKPRAVIMSAGKEIADVIGGGGEASLEDFTRQVSEGYGFGDIEALQFQEDDTGWERVLKGAGAFVGDVALDPLTYVTFGTAGLARKAAGEAVEAASRAAYNQVTEATAKQVAGEISEESAQQAIKNSQSILDDAAKIDLNRAAEEATGLGTNRLNAVDEFAGRATEAWYKGGSRAVKNFYKEQFGEELGTQTFNNLPDVAKGGLGLWIPFTNIKAGSIGAGGSLTDLTGMGKITGSIYESINKFRTKARTTDLPVLKTGGKWLSNLGIDGKEYQEFLKGLYSDTVNERSRLTYAQYMKNKKAFRDKLDLTHRLARPAALVLADYNSANKELQKEVDKLVFDPNALKLAQETNPNAPQVILATRVRQTQDDLHQEAIDAGLDIGSIENYATFYLKEEGISMKRKKRPVKGAEPTLDENLSEAGREAFRERVSVTGVPEQGTRSRTTFVKYRKDAEGNIVYDANGKPIVDEFYNPIEINKIFRDLGLPEIAEDNTANMISRYVDIYTNMITNKKFADDLIDSGVLSRGSMARGRTAILDEDGKVVLSAAVRRAADAGDINREVANFLDSPEKVSNYITTITEDTGISNYEKFDNLMLALIRREKTILEDLERKAAEPGKILKEGEAARKAREAKLRTVNKNIKSYKDKLSNPDITESQKLLFNKRLQQAQDEAKSLRAEKKEAPTFINQKYENALKQTDEKAIEETRKRIEELQAQVVLPGRESLDDIYLRQGLAQFGAGSRNVFVPQPFENVFGNEVVISGLERIFRTPSDSNSALKAIGDGLTEYMRFFRTGATVGRGPGFVFRNAIGATWQNVIAGVRARDYEATSKVFKKIVETDYFTANLQNMNPTVAGRALESLRKKNLIDDETLTTSKEFLDINGYVSEATVQSIKEGMLERVLPQIKLRGTDVTGYDIYKAAVDSQVFDETRVLREFAGDDPSQSVTMLSQQFARQRAGKRQYVAPEKSKEELNRIEKLADGILNLGVNIKVGDRTVVLRPTDLTIRLNNRTEQLVRMAAISAGLRMYGKDEAGQALSGLLMKGVHFDYQDLSEFERQVMRNVLPFWTWTRNNVPLQFRAILMNPGKVNTLMRGWEYFNNIMADEDGDMYFTPDWVQERFGFALGEEQMETLRKLPLPSWLKPGEHPLMVSLESPLMDINKIFRDPRSAGLLGALDWKELVSGASPVFKVPVEVTTQQSLFTGAPYGPEGVELPAFLRPIAEATGGSLPVIGGVNEAGEPVMSEAFYNAVKQAVPSIGVPERLVPQVFGSPAMEERQASSIYSSIFGLPTATLTPRQELGELYGRNIELEPRLKSAAAARGLDYDALKEAAKIYTVEQLRDFIAQGYFKLM